MSRITCGGVDLRPMSKEAFNKYLKELRQKSDAENAQDAENVKQHQSEVSTDPIEVIVEIPEAVRDFFKKK